jgi:hypothetical protein
MRSLFPTKSIDSYGQGVFILVYSTGSIACEINTLRRISMQLPLIDHHVMRVGLA